jgi:hypothetical protein
MENTEVSINLTIADWNVVMGILGQGPFVTVAPLIEKIKSQANDQLNKPAEEN